jgi:hypothetical protein
VQVRLGRLGAAQVPLGDDRPLDDRELDRVGRLQVGVVGEAHRQKRAAGLTGQDQVLAVQPMADGIARRVRLAGRGARAGGLRRVTPVGAQPGAGRGRVFASP